MTMRAVFVELPAFERHRSAYLDDDQYRNLQELLLLQPDAGARISGGGGIRKLRFGDARRGKGKRGGLRVIYFWWEAGAQCWLFTVYDKDEMADLDHRQREAFRRIMIEELAARKSG